MPARADRIKLIGGMLTLALLDQGVKWLARTQLQPDQPLVLIPNVFQLTLAYNTGAAFSILRQQPQLLTIITAGIFLGLLLYGLLRHRSYLPRELPALILILGGALGNLIDRLLQGRVTDYFDVIAIRYPVFNLADTFIFCGVAMLVWLQLRPQAAIAQHPPEPSPHEHP